MKLARRFAWVVFAFFLLALGGCQRADFDIHLNPTPITVILGSHGTTALTITPKNHFTGTVRLSLENAPKGVTITPTSLTVHEANPVTQILTIRVATDVAPGTYNLRAKATSERITKTANLILFVSNGGNPMKELPELSQNLGEVAYIHKVIDGDTVKLLYKGRNEEARLVGVDTPEPKTRECWNLEATQFTRTTLPHGTEVRITFDFWRGERCKFGRLLVYIWVNLDDDKPLELFNAALIRHGHGRVFTVYKFEELSRFQELERRAKKERAGLWGACP